MVNPVARNESVARPHRPLAAVFFLRPAKTTLVPSEQRAAGFSWLLLVPLTQCDFRTSKDAFTESWPQVHSDITQFHQAVPGVHSVYLLSRQGLIQLDRCVAEKK